MFTMLKVNYVDHLPHLSGHLPHLSDHEAPQTLYSTSTRVHNAEGKLSVLAMYIVAKFSAFRTPTHESAHEIDGKQLCNK